MMWSTRLSAMARMIVQPEMRQVAAILMALIAASLGVAYSVHKSRVYLNQLQILQVERDHLEVEWGQLLLEQQAWGAYGRIGKVATDELGMRTPAPHEVMMVRP
jgi:cell division protein FtsL